jgi:O-succinylbenzoate synthase
VDGALPVRPVAPDATALAAAVPPPDVEARWLARHDRLEALLAETGRAA